MMEKNVTKYFTVSLLGFSDLAIIILYPFPGLGRKLIEKLKLTSRGNEDNLESNWAMEVGFPQRDILE